MKTKIFALLLVLMMAVSLAACTQSTAPPSGSVAPSSSAPSPSDGASEEPPAPTGYNGVDDFQISEDPITLTLFYFFGSTGAPKGDMPVWQKVAEYTNVSMENVANESITEFTQSLNTMLAAGALPDIIHGPRDGIDPIVEQGAFLPLDDLIEQYAPNIKKFLEDYEDARIAGTGTDGQFYTITGTLGGAPGKSLPSMGLFIRQDWLDALSLSVPTTFEDLKSVLYAFRNNDPNGNSAKDEIPYFYRDKGVHPLYQFFNAYRDWYIDEDDGRIHHGKSELEYKNALKELAQWYADGIIDPEIFTRGSQARQTLLGENTGGMTMDWITSTAAVNDAVRELVPDINFSIIAPPADINGDVKMVYSRASIHTYTWGISKDCKDPIAAIQYMDFFFTDIGEKLVNFGIEGEHYTMSGDEIAFTEEVLTFETGFANFLRSIGAGYEIGSRGNMKGEFANMNEIASTGFQMYLDSNWIMAPFPTLSFTEDERKVIDDNWSNVNALMDEYEQSALMGVVDVDATWDKYVTDLNSMKLDAMLEAYNSAYSRYLAK